MLCPGKSERFPMLYSRRVTGFAGSWWACCSLLPMTAGSTVPCPHRRVPLETVFSTVGCAWRPSCSWNYGCLWFWHTALWTTWHLCSAFVTSSPVTTHYPASFPLCSPFPFPTILSIMTEVSTVDTDLGCAPQLLHLTPITSLNTECESFCLDIFAHCVPEQGVMPDTWIWRWQTALMLWLNSHPIQMVQLVPVDNNSRSHLSPAWGLCPS